MRKKGGSQNQPGADSYARTFDKKVSDNAIAIDGQLTDNQLKFSSYTKVIKDDGTAGQIKDDSKNGKITVSGAKAITIITSIGTDYKNELSEIPYRRDKRTARCFGKRICIRS